MPSQTFDQYLDDADKVIRYLNICCSGSTHKSSDENDKFKPLGRLKQAIPPTHALADLQYRVDTTNKMPPIPIEDLTIYNEADTVNVFIVHIAQRCKTIFNLVCPHLRLSYQAEWTRFDDPQAAASLDLLWRVEYDGRFHPLCFSEFKKPGSIDLDEWKQAIGGTNRLEGKSGMQSQQLTRYHHLMKKPRSQLCDLATTVTINMRTPLNTLMLSSAGTRRECATAEVWFCENGTSVGGESVIRSTLMFLWECLGEDDWL
jgi:hypothetical protein